MFHYWYNLTAIISSLTIIIVTDINVDKVINIGTSINVLMQIKSQHINFVPWWGSDALF